MRQRGFLGIESSEGQKVEHSVMSQYSFLYFDQQDTLENHGLESFQFP